MKLVPQPQGNAAEIYHVVTDEGTDVGTLIDQGGDILVIPSILMIPHFTDLEVAGTFLELLQGSIEDLVERANDGV